MGLHRLTALAQRRGPARRGVHDPHADRALSSTACVWFKALLVALLGARNLL